MGVYSRGPVYWIRYADPEGNIVRESSKQGDRQIAERLCRQRKAEVAAGEWRKPPPHRGDVFLPDRAKRRQPSKVYFVAEPMTGVVKIGSASNPLGRLRTIQAHSPVPLVLLGTMRGGRALEVELHAQFKDARLHGEWFTLTPEIARYVDERCTGSEHTDPKTTLDPGES